MDQLRVPAKVIVVATVDCRTIAEDSSSPEPAVVVILVGVTKLLPTPGAMMLPPPPAVRGIGLRPAAGVNTEELFGPALKGGIALH